MKPVLRIQKTMSERLRNEPKIRKRKLRQPARKKPKPKPGTIAPSPE
jgi:hypothetical protein